jgi:hypothetical protein
MLSIATQGFIPSMAAMSHGTSVAENKAMQKTTITTATASS